MKLGEVLQQAIEEKKNDINTFVWKYKDKTSKLLVDMDQNELHYCLNHCNSMLYNNKENNFGNKYNPGKYQVKKNLNNLYEHCNAVLFARSILANENVDLNTNKKLLDCIVNMKQSLNLTNESTIDEIFDNVPNVYKNIKVETMIMFCLDRLETINKKIISTKFILNQGIWLTNKELKDLEEYENDKIRNRLIVIKERLLLPMNLQLTVKKGGLSYKEFKALACLSESSRLTELPTSTIEVLVNRIIVLLINDVMTGIEFWEDMKNKVDKVLEAKCLS